MSNRIRILLVVVASLVVFRNSLAQSSGTADKAPPASDRRTVPIEGQFGPEWRQTVALPETRLGAGDRLVLWVEEGWLCARREASDGEFDWQIVLCQIEDDVSPVVQVKDGKYFAEVSYDDGRYFIRESLGLLRAIRDDSPGGPLLAKDAVFGADVGGGPTGWSTLATYTAVRTGAWFFVALGPEKDAWRAVVRLDPLDRQGGYGVSMAGAGHAHYFHGEETWLIDDGQLLVANRMLPAAYESIKKRERIREAIVAGDELPPIDAASWLNADEAPTWESLQGKVVLVDFWGTWCGPCVAKLPDTQALHEEYADRGLVVIGIHSEQAADTCAAFLEEHDYTFPVAVDSGKTAEGFAIESWPSYFLIDRTGRVVTSYTHTPPTAEEIEALLDKGEPDAG